MESAIYDLLKNLCDKYGWSYGILWSYDEENPLLLTLKNMYFVEELRVLANDMFRKVHVVGDGLVGQVAFSGMHSWVFSDTLLEEAPFQFADAFQVPSDVQCHFSNGIMTVAVVPLESQGVAQFGSFMKIAESMEFIDEAKRLFSEIETVDESINRHNEEFDYLLDQLLSPTCDHQPAVFETLPPLVDNCHQNFQSDQPCFSPMLSSVQSSLEHNVPLNADFEPQQSYSMDSLGSDDIQLLASLLEDPEEISLDHVLQKSRSFMDNNTTKNVRPMAYETSQNIFQESKNFLNQEYDQGQLNESQKKSYDLGSNILPCVTNCSVPSHPAPSYWHDLAHFGQVSTSGICSTSAQESLMGITRNMPDYSPLLLNGISSQGLKYNADWTARSHSWMRQTSINSRFNYKQMDASKESVKKVTKVVKKKAKPGEARHRPKDRELQQKFYKQLRSLVPDGQKCTQDGLLKRTIRHISFLQSVSKHADTLKNGYHPKLLANDISLESPETLNTPIHVKVLSPAGYYAIEITWDASLPFFETLDRLQIHGLNILNGAMETLENKTRAYFIVETVQNSSKEDTYLLITQLLNELYSSCPQPDQQLISSPGQFQSQSTNSNVPFPHHNVVFNQF